MTAKRKRDLTLPDLVVLSVLSERPMHGYQLVSELELREVKDWAAISRPQVYYSLNKLIELKMLSVTEGADNSLGPEKTTYKINAKGKEKLAESLSTLDWAQQRTLPPFLTWMALSAHLPKTAIRQLFEERRKFLKSELSRERATLNSFSKNSDDMSVAGKLMVELTIKTFEVELDWLESAQMLMINR
jgi:DNA-binding PadR family transcriptional regulator